MTDAEEKWNDFIMKELEKLKKVEDPQAYKPDDLDLAVLTAAFAVMVVLPLKKEIKHDLHLLEAKIANA